MTDGRGDDRPIADGRSSDPAGEADSAGEAPNGASEEPDDTAEVPDSAAASGDDRASAREPSDDLGRSIAGSDEPTADANADGPLSVDGTQTAIDRVPKTLRRVRTEPAPHLVALGMAVALGLAFAWLHWVGLLIGGALVGLCARSLPRAVGAGIGFGVLVLVVFALSLGTATPVVVGMAPAVYLAVGAAIGLPAFGALVRGVI